MVNALGHTAGVLLFGMILVLLVQDRASRKSIVAAGLAFAWNLASLIVLGGDPDTLAGRWTVAAGFSVLSLLPAVLFDLSMAQRALPLVRTGYLLSGLAIAPHIVEVFRPDADLHRLALTAISIGFGALTAIAAFVHRGSTPRLIGTMSLFLLAMSFVHLGDGHAEQIWSQELAFHHAAIPLALLVLLQDYRFVLLDAFLRFVVNFFLAAGFVSAAALAWRAEWIAPPASPVELALLLTGACLALVGFAMARNRVQDVLTRVVFLRTDEAMLLAGLRVPVRDAESYLQTAAEQLGRYVGASTTIATEPGGQTSVAVRAAGGTRYLQLGRRTGGRRYLSEDLRVLERAAAAISEQLDLHHESELRRLVTQAELRALQSQIHPHFLFNALNALYGIIPREAMGARDTVLNLADLLRYFLDTRKAQVPLSEELRIVRAYLDVERLRLGNKLKVEIHVDPAALNVAIPMLTVQPLVENAIKHGIAPLAKGGFVQLSAEVREGALLVSVRDTGHGFQKASPDGIGLENVRRRLELSYSGAAKLEIASTGAGSTVSFQIPMPVAQAMEVAG